MMKLKLQHFDHLMQRADSLEKTLMLGKTEGRRRRGQQSWMASCLNKHEFKQKWRTRKSGVLQSMGWQRARYNWVTEQQNTNQWTMNMKGKKFPDLDLTKLWYFKIFYLKMYFQTLEYEQRGKIYIFDSWYLRKGASENCCIHIYDAK